MTVAELINELEKCNPNAEVTIYNDDMYINGTYKVTEVEGYSDGYNDEVMLRSDYKDRLEGNYDDE